MLTHRCHDVEPAEPTERGELFAACEAPVQRESAVAARISKPPYLPGGHTAAAVISYLDAHPEERAAVISAELAGIPQAPTLYDPYRFPERARKRFSKKDLLGKRVTEA